MVVLVENRWVSIPGFYPFFSLPGKPFFFPLKGHLGLPRCGCGEGALGLFSADPGGVLHGATGHSATRGGRNLQSSCSRGSREAEVKPFKRNR